MERVWRMLIHQPRGFTPTPHKGCSHRARFRNFWGVADFGSQIPFDHFIVLRPRSEGYAKGKCIAWTVKGVSNGISLRWDLSWPTLRRWSRNFWKVARNPSKKNKSQQITLIFSHVDVSEISTHISSRLARKGLIWGIYHSWHLFSPTKCISPSHNPQI